MAKLTGLEPAASGVTGRRSNQLSYNSNLWCSKMGLNHRRPALQAGALPLSYPSECLSVGPGSLPDLAGSELRRPPTTGPPRAVRDSRKDIHIDGRSSGVRTHDLPPPRRTRYQAAPYSDFRSIIQITGTLGDGAGDRVRTGDIQLGRLALYQLSYARVAVLPRPTVPSIRRSREATELPGGRNLRPRSTLLAPSRSVSPRWGRACLREVWVPPSGFWLPHQGSNLGRAG